jgi:hypothetical protein
MSLVALVLALLCSSYSQNKNSTDMEKSKENNEIISNARKAVGVPEDEIRSFYIKLKHSFLTKVDIPNGSSLPDTLIEINSIIPDKIQSIWSIEKPFPSKTRNLWNGAKHKRLSEFEAMGQIVVRDTTDSSQNGESLKLLEGKTDKEKLEMLKKARAKDPKENFYNQIWFGLFPLVLSNPFEPNLEFKYVGKAQSSNQTANVVDVKAKNGKSYRLLFDSQTNYLLMMIENYKGDDGDYEIKYYYSNREKVNNVLIPKKIKVESKFTSTGKEPRISYSTIDVLEFKLNPELKESIFEIK